MIFYFHNNPSFINLFFNPPSVLAYKSIKIHFDNENDVQKFADLIGQKITEKTKYLWFPKKENLDLINYSNQNES